MVHTNQCYRQRHLYIFVVGAHDEYYGSEPSEDAYNNLRELYQKEVCPMRRLMTCLYWMSRMIPISVTRVLPISNGQGGGLFVEDDAVMGMAFGKIKKMYE